MSFHIPARLDRIVIENIVHVLKSLRSLRSFYLLAKNRFSFICHICDFPLNFFFYSKTFCIRVFVNDQKYLFYALPFPVSL